MRKQLMNQLKNIKNGKKIQKYCFDKKENNG